MLKYKKGDVVKFGNTMFTILTKRGADAINKHKPKKLSDMRKFSRPSRDQSVGRAERNPHRGWVNSNSLDDLVRF